MKPCCGNACVVVVVVVVVVAVWNIVGTIFAAIVVHCGQLLRQIEHVGFVGTCAPVLVGARG